MSAEPARPRLTNLDRALDALRSLHEAGERTPTTERVMEVMRDDRGSVYGALMNGRQKGLVERGGTGKMSGNGRAPVRWRIKPVIQGG